MTGRTVPCRRYVIGGLSCRAGAVMAAGATSGDARVVETNRRPVRGGVTVAAVSARRNVPRGLANRLYPVVARRAVGSHTRMIEACDLPLARGVTGIAGRLRGHMSGGLAGGAHGIMAIRADLWCAFEATVGMAGIASERSMRPGERKAGLEVIEGGRRLRISGTGNGSDGENRQHHHKDRQDPFAEHQVVLPFATLKPRCACAQRHCGEARPRGTQ